MVAVGGGGGGDAAEVEVLAAVPNGLGFACSEAAGLNALLAALLEGSNHLGVYSVQTAPALL